MVVFWRFGTGMVAGVHVCAELFTALKDQLGLKLEAIRAPVEVIARVVEPPSPGFSVIR